MTNGVRVDSGSQPFGYGANPDRNPLRAMEEG